jgi:hypothetical protein
LGTTKRRLESDSFESCIAYKSSTNKFNQAAKQLLVQFDTALNALKYQLGVEKAKRCAY